MAEKLAVVTGASSGIGFNLAKVFAENGYDVVIGAESGIQEAASQLSTQGVTVIPVTADLATFEGCKSFWQEVEATGRKVDAVALNAGIGVAGRFVETDLDREISIVRLNCESTVHLAKYALKKMVSQGEGRLLITSSIAAEMVAPTQAVYSATKAFDLSLAKSLRYELKDTGVTVTALQPGPTDTNFFAGESNLADTKLGTTAKNESKPYDVAKQGFEALMAGEEHVYAAALTTKVQGALLGVLPEALSAKANEKLTEPANK
jgi:short-subunit dehydrogenase